MKVSKTNRGFKLIEFTDLYSKPCSIQESSLATKEALWLGVDKATHLDASGRVTTITDTCLSRMHIDKKLAKEIVKVLNKFIKTGRIT